MLKFVKDKIKRLKKSMDEESLAKAVFKDDYVKAQMIDLNQSQMFDKGIDAEGDSLGEYSKVSVQVYGKPPGHIKLYDTGEFYESMKVKVSGTEAVITGDMIKPDRDLSIQWPKALGLTDESKGEIISMAKDIIREKIRADFAG